MTDSVFTRIIRGDIPSHKVYEDEKTYVFMDIQPIQPGMVLIVPKTQAENFYELEDADYNAVFLTLKKVSAQIKKVFPGKRVGVMIEGLDVPHAHIKVFPFNTAEEYRALPTNAEPNHKALAEMAQKLAI